MNILMVNLPATNLFKTWCTSLWFILHKAPHNTLGILDLVLESASTPVIPDIGIEERIDWRFKSELDCHNINGKQRRWVQQWMGRNQFDIVLYSEHDIDTHLVRVIVDAGRSMQLQHIVVPIANDCDFLIQASEAAMQRKTSGK